VRRKIRIKALETVGVVRDNAVTFHVDFKLFDFSGYATNQDLTAWSVDNYRVARRPCGRPALSELAVKVSLHPAQALRMPLWRRRGFETRRR
jgi:hypothetical protein